jgi:hypothetical protein
MNHPPLHRVAKLWVIWLATATLSLTIAGADIPDRDRPSRAPAALSGMYQVVSSSDPLFPMDDSRKEWFLDFSEGTRSGKTSGRLAVSLRENPRVQVRILVWQIFPREGTLTIGNAMADGGRGAVALAQWNVTATNHGIALERDGLRIVLRRAQPADF